MTEASRQVVLPPQDVFDLMPLGAGVVDADGRWLLVNLTLCDRLACTRDELLASTLFACTHPQDADPLRALHKRLASGELDSYAGLVRLMVRGTEPFVVRLTLKPMSEAGRLPSHFVALIAEAGGPEGIAAAALEGDARWRLLFEHTPHPLFLFDKATLKIAAVNQAAVEQYGYTREEFTNLLVTDLRPVDDVPEFLAFLQGSSARHRGVWRHRRKDGSAFHAEIRTDEFELGGRRLRLFSANEVTEQIELQAQLLQAQKMEAVGLLAGGVAHDFNNILTTIIGYSDLIYEQLGPADLARHAVGEIRRSADRAAALTRQLLAFSRKQFIQPRVIDLNTIVAGMQRMLTRLVGEHIRIVTRLDPGLGHVRADPHQIEHAIINLAINSRDAMPHGGELTLLTRPVSLDDGFLRTHVGARSGPHALLEVSDTGSGIEPELLSRIFEPFFTTKEPGKGTGLGLSTVYGIVKQNGGSIAVESTPGRRTTFRIYLPTVDEPIDQAELHRRPTDRGTHETILVVEDEEPVRHVMVRTLQRRGYAVLAAKDGRQALRLQREHPGIDLVLTDVVMPGMTGFELASWLRAHKPDLKVVCTSGYAEDPLGRLATLSAAGAFLPKPFSPDALVEAVHGALSPDR